LISQPETVDQPACAFHRMSTDKFARSNCIVKCVNEKNIM